MNLYVLCGDLHIDEKSPIYRSDKDYLGTCLGKLNQIVQLANKYNCPVLCSGDVFEKSSVSHSVVNAVISVLSKLNKNFFTVLGNHDQYYHQPDNLCKTPIGTLQHAGVITVVKKEGLIYGCSFNSEIPKPKRIRGNILLIHHPVTNGKPPFFMEDAISARDMMKEAKEFQFIVSGDYHDPYCVKTINRILVNTGPMLRKTIDQVNLKPCMWLLDTANVTVKRIPFRIEKANDVFNIVEAKGNKKKEEKFKSEMDELIKTLKKDNTSDFNNVIKKVIKKFNPNRKVQEKVHSFLGAE